MGANLPPGWLFRPGNFRRGVHGGERVFPIGLQIGAKKQRRRSAARSRGPAVFLSERCGKVCEPDEDRERHYF